MERIGMAQAMRPLKGDSQSTAAGPRLKHIRDSGACQRTQRGAGAQEELAAGAGRALMAQILQEGRADSVSEWEDEWLTRLVLREQQDLPPPLDVLQGQRHDITVAEAIRGDQEQHRIIAPSWCRRPINRQEQLAHGLPREDPR